MYDSSTDTPTVQYARRGNRIILSYTESGVPQFEPTNRTGAVVCAITGQRMRISNISPEAQKELRIEETIVGIFIEGANGWPHKIFLEDERLIDISCILWKQLDMGEVQIQVLDRISYADCQHMFSIIKRMKPNS